MRKFSVPESYTSPKHLYQVARERGMDFVTITDHNAITGALEIAHLANTFVSSEITAHFPENGCKVHVVVLHISEIQFQSIMIHRKNIYDLVAYLHSEKIAHFLAHPLYAQNDKLNLEIIDRSLLLFTTFEIKNGCRAHRFNGFTKRLVSSLNEAVIERLANKYDLQPYGATPWVKGIVGGSDDHGGLFIARAHTTVYDTPTIDGFIDAIRSGDSWADGEDGGPLTMAHSLYGIAHSFYRERLGERRRGATPFVSALLDRFFNIGTDKGSFLDKIRLFVLKNLPASSNHAGKSFEEILDSEARLLLNDTAFLASINMADSNGKIFAVTSRLANRLIFHYTNRLMTLPHNAGFFDYLNTIGTIGLVHSLISPYYLAFHHQHKGKELIRDLTKALPEMHHKETPEKIALFTDTLDEINGVAITIKRLISTARNRGVELTVITSGEDGEVVEGVKKFKSVGDFVLPEYPELKLNFPPILDVMAFIEREGFTRIHVSTPGTVGLLGLLISRLMDIPVAGTYHTDIPQYVRNLTNDEFLEKAAWSYMIWFYSQMEEVMVPSVGTREQLQSRGLPPERMKPLPRWVDTDTFTPEMRNPGFWTNIGIDQDKIVLLYVGRVSREKGLKMLVDAFRELVDSGSAIALAVIGDGPYRKDMETSLTGYPALFTGYLGGEQLQLGYASADLFVFPSATDTFGNVVLEAQASGLPVIVSDEGGPRELMIDGETGVVFSAGSKNGLISAIRLLINDPQRITHMGHNARRFTLDNAPDSNQTYSTILNLDTQQLDCIPDGNTRFASVGA
jgi:glycosyltransferase involved in cell wall biosynthesis